MLQHSSDLKNLVLFFSDIIVDIFAVLVAIFSSKGTCALMNIAMRLVEYYFEMTCYHACFSTAAEEFSMEFLATQGGSYTEVTLEITLLHNHYLFLLQLLFCGLLSTLWEGILIKTRIIYINK